MRCGGRNVNKVSLYITAGERCSTPVSATPTHMLRICANSPTMRVVDGVDPYKIKAQSTANKRNKKFSHHPVSAGTGVTPALHFQRACRLACTNLLGFLVRYVRTRGSMRLRRAAKPPILPLPLCRTHLPRMARATNSCTPPEVRKEDGVSPPC